MKTRRQFLQKAGLLSGASLLAPLAGKAMQEKLDYAFRSRAGQSADALATDEDFWAMIQQAFTVNSNLINLNNGGVAPAPKSVQDAVERYARLSNEAPSYYMWRILDQGREPLRKKLAALAGVSPEELALHRNASEALETAIFGLRLRQGDEVILCKQDYPNMINAWKQREKRDGIKLVWLNFEFPMENKEAIINRYIGAITPATRVIHLTHIINWMGQIMPAKEIVREAHNRNVEVVLDAAHSFGHIQYDVADIG